MKPILLLSMYIIALFATNDGLRDTFVQNSTFSYLKEFIVISLFAFLAVARINMSQTIKNKGLIVYNLACLFLLATSFFTTKMMSLNDFLRADSLLFGGWSVWIKILVFVLLTNSLILLYKTDRSVYEKIPFMYISGTVMYCLVTIFFIVSGLNKYLPMRDWYGRLSIGYPPMDSLILVIACVFSYFYVKKLYQNVLLHTLFIFVLLMQNTISGYLAFCAYLIFMMLTLRGKWKLIPLSLLISVFAAIISVYTFLATEMGTFGILIIDKINGFIFGAKTGSISLRQEQINFLMDFMKSELSYMIFGIGGIGAFAVENLYYSIFGMFGIIGLFLFGILFGYMTFVFKKRKDHVGLILVVLYLLGSLSLTGIYVYPLIFICSYIISRLYLGLSNESFKSTVMQNKLVYKN